MEGEFVILYDQYREQFDQLVVLTSKYKQIPETAIRRDYLIVEVLEKLVKVIMENYVFSKEALV